MNRAPKAAWFVRSAERLARLGGRLKTRLAPAAPRAEPAPAAKTGQESPPRPRGLDAKPEPTWDSLAEPSAGPALPSPGRSSRPLHYLAAMVLGLGFTSILTLLAITHIKNLNETAFETAAEEVKAAINQRLTRSIEIVHGMAILFHAPYFVDTEEFRIVSEELVRRAPNIDLAAYIPIVQDRNRARFEWEMREVSGRPYAITEDLAGERIPASTRKRYMPVQLLQPATAGTASLMGFDFLSDEKLRAAVLKAIETGKSALAGYFQETDGSKRYWLLRATYKARETPKTAKERRASATAIVAVRIDPMRLFDADSLAPDVGVTLVGGSATGAAREQILFYKQAQIRQRLIPTSSPILTRVYRIQIGEQLLILNVAKRLSWLDVNPTISLIAFGVGLLITVLLLVLARYTILRARDLEQRHEDVSRSVKLKTRQLSKSEERYRRLVETTNVILFEADADTLQITYIGPQVVKLLGYAVDDWYEANFWINHIHVADRARGIQLCRETVALGRDHAFECRMLSADGRTVWLRNLVTIAADDPDRKRLQGAMLDITQVKEASIAMSIAKQEAEIASRAKSDFLANVSHELRTPLNAVIGFSEMISKETFGPVGDIHYREYAKDIHDSGCHLLSLINDILDVSKIEAGKFELHEEPVALANVVASAMRFVKERAKFGRLTLSNETPEDLPKVLADERSLKQVLLNLLTNAVKFTPPGGRVTVRAGEDRDGNLWFAVMDTGIGIAEEDLPRALEPFGQVESHLSRRYEGTGLGLPLSKRLVEMHSGRFEIESEVRVGTTVTVTLPATRRVDGAGTGRGQRHTAGAEAC